MLWITLGFSTIILVFIVWRFWFFLRDPKRNIPQGTGMLSAADGYVVYVQRIEAGQIPVAIKNKRPIRLDEITRITAKENVSGTLIGVYMTAFSVHRNRIPLAGELVSITHHPAPHNFSMARTFTNLLLSKQPYVENSAYIVKNERMTIGIKTTRGTISVTQIADAWINRILVYPNIGTQVHRGAQYGMIRFGSQVDIFFPDTIGLLPVVTPGQYVKAGLSTLAVFANDDDQELHNGT